MKKIFTPLFLFCFFHLSAQDQTVKGLQAESGKSIKKEEDTTNSLWRKGGLFSLNLSQGSLKNWSAGGDDFSLSINSFLNVFAFYKKDKYSWDNTLDLNFGYVKTTSLVPGRMMTGLTCLQNMVMHLSQSLAYRGYSI